MSPKLVENLFDFFHQQIQEIIRYYNHQLSKEGILYLSNLLVERAEQPKLEYPETLAELRFFAVKQNPLHAARVYREMGDRALFVSGFFRQSLDSKIVGLDYYLNMGAMAYSYLSKFQDMGMPPVFSELSHRFASCSEILRDVYLNFVRRVEAKQGSGC